MGEDSKPFAVTSINFENEESKPHLLTACRAIELEYPFKMTAASGILVFVCSWISLQLWSEYSITI